VEDVEDDRRERRVWSIADGLLFLLLVGTLHAAEHMIACRGSSAEAASVSGDGAV
jgi:hypothetical protein